MKLLLPFGYFSPAIHFRISWIALSCGTRLPMWGMRPRVALGEAENVFAKIIVKHERLSGEDINEVFAEKQQIIRKSGLLEYYATSENFDQVGGLAVLKDWMNKRALAFSNEARAFGLPSPKGILMLGVQGCGKSLCAKAVSNQWQLPLLRFDMGRMFGSLVGSSEENIRRAIAVAESVAPTILWVDEIDKAFAGARNSGGTDGGTTARVLFAGGPQYVLVEVKAAGAVRGALRGWRAPRRP